jgi:hypothetical protein
MILIGDVQVDVARIMREKLNEAINEGEQYGADELFITVVFNFEPEKRAFRLRLITTEKQPPMKLLGTAVYKVNYRQGKVDRLWILPMQKDDLVAMAAVTTGLEPDFIDQEIIQSAQSIKPALLYRPMRPITDRA